ncbi:MAG: type IV secretion system DNA-binding domain-containing protein [Acidothermales bacterium]|nr:type IV secretion system DNA-binding domain-containing protein [Acidothermales bacterium]
MLTDSGADLIWRQVHWSRPLDAARAVAVLRAWAADQRSPRLVLEARATGGRLRYLLGMPFGAQASVEQHLTTVLPGVQVTDLSAKRPPVLVAGRLKLSTRHRPLRTDDPEATVRAVLGALTHVRRYEHLVLQVVLGPRRIPLAVATNSPSSVVAPLWQTAWHGNGGTIDGEKRTALRSKVSEPGFACTVRLGVTAGTAVRQRELLVGLTSALRTTEAAGVQLGLVPDSARRLDTARAPWLWPLRLNVVELLNLLAWPLGDGDLPGQPAAHPKPLLPAPGTTGKGRIVARATAPGIAANLTLGARDVLHHVHVLGPTGTGKSTLLTNLIAQDMADGRAVVVVDPQGDLIHDVLEHVPAHRRDDVAVLDPSDAAMPVGLNPLQARGRNPEVVADGLLAVCKGLYGDAIGPRSQDILHACLLTLANRGDASLVMLPLLLTNTGFRRSLTQHAMRHDPIALGPFWAWYEGLSEAERQAVTAPVMNKLRQWLIRPSLRNVLGQRRPKLSIQSAMAEKRIVLVSLAQGVLGPEGAALLGSLVVAELWQATVERANLAKDRRHLVMVFLDEFSAFLHLPTDLADALARSRGFGVGYTLAHQFLSQLSPAMRSAVLANTRSRVCFQLAHDDALTIARSHSELTADDFTALGRYEVYASLFAGGQVTPYASGRTPAPAAASSNPAELRQRSRIRYGQPLSIVEAEFAEMLRPDPDTADETQLPHGRRTRRGLA